MKIRTVARSLERVYANGGVFHDAAVVGSSGRHIYILQSSQTPHAGNMEGGRRPERTDWEPNRDRLSHRGNCPRVSLADTTLLLHLLLATTWPLYLETASRGLALLKSTASARSPSSPVLTLLSTNLIRT